MEMYESLMELAVSVKLKVEGRIFLKRLDDLEYLG